ASKACKRAGAYPLVCKPTGKPADFVAAIAAGSPAAASGSPPEITSPSSMLRRCAMSSRASENVGRSSPAARSFPPITGNSCSCALWQYAQRSGQPWVNTVAVSFPGQSVAEKGMSPAKAKRLASSKTAELRIRSSSDRGWRKLANLPNVGSLRAAHHRAAQPGLGLAEVRPLAELATLAGVEAA